MILEILIFLITTLVGYFIYINKQINNYFKQRDVKHLPGVPFFGNTYDVSLLKKHLVEELQDIYNAFPDEKYVGYLEMTTPILLIRDPELIKTITIKDFEHFTDHRAIFSEDIDPLFSGSLVFMKGEKWRHMRSTLSPAFTASKMKFMLPFIIENANNILDYLEVNQSEILDVDDIIRRFTTDVIASAGFGFRVNSLKDKDNEFYQYGSNILNFTAKQKLLMTLIVIFPSVKKLGVRLFDEKVHAFFRNIVSSSMDYRKNEKVELPDMIQLLMEASGEWTIDELIGQVFIFFIAGFDTVATALVMAIHEIAINHDVQQKLYQEARKFKEEKELTFDNLGELKYLDCVVNESLRKWSPAVLLDRTCVKTYELPPPREGGKPCILKPRDVVYSMVTVLHMDPKHFPEPEKFDPDRFSEEDKHNIKPFTFLPFGAGPRACIGNRFAMMEIKVLLYYIILNFKIVETEKTTNPIKLKPDSTGIKALGGTWAKFEKRN